ncbi:facilitated trehalose transporter Tret1-like isoform X1 [Planococcus citri]|uniref:facilitated trehalose transporter Tret1-like isoform X1 n=1 Tax=Planococcus citri TaxID=170843 RepID=UPI0031F7F027
MDKISSSRQNLDKDNSNSKWIFAQVLAALAGTIITTNLSAMTSSITIVNGYLKESSRSNFTNGTASNGDFMISDAEASFYATLQLATHFIASVFSGVFQDGCGRKKCMMVSIFPQLASWIVLHYSTSIYWLYMHSICVGLGTAFSEVTIITYISEISNVELRGRLFSLGKIGYGFGSFVAFFLANFIHWRQLALACSVMPVIMLVYVAWLPESPLWLLSKGHEKRCKSSIKWLQGWTTDKHIEHHFAKVQEYVDQSKHFGKSDQPDVILPHTRQNVTQRIYQKYVRLFFLPEFVEPFKIISVLFLCSYFLSLRPAKFYLVNILGDLGVKADQMKIMTISSLAQVSGSLTLAATVRKFGKRDLTLWTFTSCAICLAFSGAYSYAHFHHNVDAVWIVYLIYGLIFYFSGFTLGGMPWFYCAEIFPQKIRGVSGGIAATFAHILVALLTQSYLFIQSAITVTNVFLLYSVLSLISCYYLKLKLPETENKTLQEIEEHFKKKPERLNSESTSTAVN